MWYQKTIQLKARSRGFHLITDEIEQQIEDFDERLNLYRERLEKEWADLETVLSQLQAESEFLESQLGQISSNTVSILGN